MGGEDGGDMGGGGEGGGKIGGGEGGGGDGGGGDGGGSGEGVEGCGGDGGGSSQNLVPRLAYPANRKLRPVEQHEMARRTWKNCVSSKKMRMARAICCSVIIEYGSIGLSAPTPWVVPR